MCQQCWQAKISELTGGIYHPLKSTEQMAVEANALAREELKNPAQVAEE